MKNAAVEINYNIKLTSPFHIGSGYGKGLIDRTALKDKRDLFYVPGSVIKGNVRNIAEDIAKGSDLPICNPHDDKSSLRCFGFDPCIACRIFGSRKKSSGLYFEDASLVPEYQELFQKSTYLQNQDRTRIKINRRFNQAQHGALFTTEYGVSSLVFSGVIAGHINNLTPITMLDTKLCYEIILLLSALLSLKRIGGDRSVGAGWVDIDVGFYHPDLKEKVIKYNGEYISLSYCLSEDHLLSLLTYARDERKEVLGL